MSPLAKPENATHDVGGLFIEVFATNPIRATSGSPGFVVNQSLAMLDYRRRYQ